MLSHIIHISCQKYRSSDHSILLLNIRGNIIIAKSNNIILYSIWFAEYTNVSVYRFYIILDNFNVSIKQIVGRLMKIYRNVGKTSAPSP
jgi:hypothetical protein